jgi:uncharacterized cupredoxin-like copper-binding protein
MVRAPVGIAMLALSVGACGRQSATQESSTAARPQTYGRAALPQEATRTVEVRMDDGMRFDPAVIPIQHGEVITFRLVNRGSATHEFTLGGPVAQDLHEAEMAQMSMTGEMGDSMTAMPSMAHHKMPDTPEHRKYMKTLAQRIATLDKTTAANASMHVPPGQQRELTWAFIGETPPVFGCHVDQHWYGGMRGSFTWATS